MFNPVGVQSQQASGDKTAQAAESVDAAELTLQGEQRSVFLTCESKRHLALTVVIVGFFDRHAECGPQWDGSPWHASLCLPCTPVASAWFGWTENARPYASGRAS